MVRPVVIRLNADGSGYQVLYQFLGNKTDGSNPTSLRWGPDGNLYGVLSHGGQHGKGSIFRIGADGTGFAVVHHFELRSTNPEILSIEGSAWSQRTPGRSPPGLRSLAMTYDDARDRAVLYAFAQNWEWDGSEWLQRTTAVQPASREFAAMVFDLARRRIVMFGGKSVPGTVFYDDIWDYRTTAPASYAAFGAGCAGPAGTPRLRVVPRALPWIGDALELTVTAVPAGSSAFVLTGLSRTNWRGLALPFALGPVGMPGCQLLVAPAVVSSAPVTAGTALWSQPLPAQPSLIGLRFYNQGLVLAPGINAAGAVVSDAGAGTVGAR